jgi:AcrR family transcriptional regulator
MARTSARAVCDSEQSTAACSALGLEGAVVKVTKGDRRVTRTQRLLREALVALIHEKDYDAIVVREILDRANVGRSAFYAHFEDKDALLASGIRHALRAAPPRRLPSSAKRFEPLVWFSLPLFEFIRPLRDVPHRGMPARGRALVHAHLRRVLIDEIEDDLALMREQAPPGLPPRLAAEYVINTFLLVLNWWVGGDTRMSARQADDLFLRLVLPALSGDGASA